MTWSLPSFRLSHRPGKPEKARALKSFLSSVHLPLLINRICYLSYLLWTVQFQPWLFCSAFHAFIINCSTHIWAEEPWKLCLRPPGTSAHLPGQSYVLGAVLHCQLGMEEMRHKSCNSGRVKILWVVESFTFHWHVHNTCNVSLSVEPLMKGQWILNVKSKILRNMVFSAFEAQKPSRFLSLSSWVVSYMSFLFSEPQCCCL